eukprot:TRINITY_DN20554_c0_g1_i2.p2 TRINITY_DN20554_c0_g1~~TRINITY_DN20554_c0_g1_i2.p2  ORF type:complete len:118 (-),score=20.08 TRINITY_DN20554_c0_g1_i2:16-369(-)
MLLEDFQAADPEHTRNVQVELALMQKYQAVQPKLRISQEVRLKGVDRNSQVVASKVFLESQLVVALSYSRSVQHSQRFRCSFQQDFGSWWGFVWSIRAACCLRAGLSESFHAICSDS